MLTILEMNNVGGRRHRGKIVNIVSPGTLEVV
jgi:hypothetical protein